jgi:hypothetical protein
LRDEKQPEHVRRSRGESRDGAHDELAQPRASVDLEHQRAERARAFADARIDDARWHADFAERGGVERSRIPRAAGCCGYGEEPIDAVGAGE